MTFQQSYGWGDTNDDSLCMRKITDPNESSYLKPLEDNGRTFIFKFQCGEDFLPNSTTALVYRIEGDYEPISSVMICRYLLKCSECVVYPNFCEPEVNFMRGSKNFFPALKSRIGLPLKSAPLEADASDCSGSYATAALMFMIYHNLLEQGYHAFATDDQGNGVVARRVDNAYLDVCALKHCTFSSTGECCVTVQVECYKTHPMPVPAPVLPTGTQSGSADIWTRQEPPLGAVFLPLQEEVVVLAMALFQPGRSAGQAEDRAGQRAYEANLLLTDLDRLNRSKGYALYQPDSYGKFKLYWELAYGVMLPEKASQPVALVRFRAGGEQVVPLQALVRGIAEVPSRARGVAAEAIADRVFEGLRGVPLFSTLQPPTRALAPSLAMRKPTFVSARQLQAQSSHAKVPTVARAPVPVPEEEASPPLSSQDSFSLSCSSGSAPPSPAAPPQKKKQQQQQVGAQKGGAPSIAGVGPQHAPKAAVGKAASCATKTKSKVPVGGKVKQVLPQKRKLQEPRGAV